MTVAAHALEGAPATSEGSLSGAWILHISREHGWLQSSWRYRGSSTGRKATDMRWLFISNWCWS